METQHPTPEHRQPSPGQPPQRQDTNNRNRWLLPLAGILGLVVIAAAVWGFVQWRDGDDDAAQTDVSTDAEPEVIIIDESEVDVVQNPSLAATAGSDGVTVANDGNVTMHDIVVTEGDQAVCTFEEMAPGETEVCAEATAAATVSGLGPQDQPVDITVG
jgi:hypothetical protein